MIEVEKNFGDEEYGVLADLLVDSTKVKKERKVWNVILILAGAFELFMGLAGLFCNPEWMDAFYLLVATAAFFLVLGGERMLVRNAVYLRTKKANEKIGNGYRRFTFDEEEVTVASSVGNGKYSWAAFLSCGEHTHYIWLLRKDGAYILADLNLLSEDETELLRKYCAEKIPAEKK